MVKGYFDQLGCQAEKVYDLGIAEWGQQSNPVVYAKCDEGAEAHDRHLLDVRHHAGHPAGPVESARPSPATSSPSRRTRKC